MREALTVERAGTYLLVEVDHIPTRGLHQGARQRRQPVDAYLSNLANDSAPMVCRCSSTVAIDLLRLQPLLWCRCGQRSQTTHGRRGHPESLVANVILVRPIRYLGCRTKGGRGSPLERASSSFVNSFKASNRLRSVCFRFEAPSLVVSCRGVVVPDPIRGVDVST